MNHGTSINDYYRCKRANETACQPCKDAATAYQLEWRRNNRDKYNAKKREQTRRWRKKNPERTREWQRTKDRRKRARLKQLKSINFTTKDVLDLWGTDCHICNRFIDMRITRNCGEPNWEEGLHLDHVIPLSKGGHNIISNVKPSHAKCNIDKSGLLPN